MGVKRTDSFEVTIASGEMSPERAEKILTEIVNFCKIYDLAFVNKVHSRTRREEIEEVDN